MKDKFYEFYKLPKQKLDEIWNKGLLIVDTNVLLDLYRLGEESRKDLKKSIDFFGERVWLPYQAGLEFHRNRESVINELGGSKFEDFQKTLNESVAGVKETFKTFQRHPCIDYEYIVKRLERFRKELEDKISDWKKAYPFDIENDDVLKWITDKFDGKVGEDNTMEELLSIYKEGGIRYQAQVPPGYKDGNDKDKKAAGERYIYGDLIIWKAVINKAKKDKVDIIFLTNDNKEDWYEKNKGQTKGPGFELYREFHKESKQDIIIMSEASFLKEMKDKKSVKVKDSSIEDAKRALKPEVYYDWLRPIDLGWPIDNRDGFAYLPKTKIDDFDLLSSLGSMSLQGLPFKEDSILKTDPKTGYMDTGYLAGLVRKPFGLLDYEEKHDNDK